MPVGTFALNGIKDVYNRSDLGIIMKTGKLFSVLALVLGALCATAHADVIKISSIIDTTQENPSPTGVPSGAGGFALLEFDDVSKELSWNIAWQNLSGPATGMHFHAPASPGTNSGVAVNVGNISGLNSPSTGSVVVSDAFANQLLNGESYLNIHTATNGSGEIRGQVNPTNINLTAKLEASQEVNPPTGVPANAMGSAQIAFDPATNLLGWNIEWDNLSGPLTGMHFHGPADAGTNAGVQVNVGNISGLTSPSIGSMVISEEFESQLLAGQWYLNLHTEINGGGEVRGQVVPEPTSIVSLALILSGWLSVCRRRAAV